jgi:(4S)-4-hydroxy-5-phosphonooxypentane-2,3-dione isomerase
VIFPIKKLAVLLDWIANLPGNRINISMTATLVHVHVKPEFIKSFIDASRRNHENSITEAGNFRFDILQDISDPAKFVLYEVYESEEAAAAHKQTAHYLTWRHNVASWMAAPREGIKHSLLFPREN